MVLCCNSAAILREGLGLEGPFANDYLYRRLLTQGATPVVVRVMNDVFQMLIILCIWMEGYE